MTVIRKIRVFIQYFPHNVCHLSHIDFVLPAFNEEVFEPDDVLKQVFLSPKISNVVVEEETGVLGFLFVVVKHKKAAVCLMSDIIIFKVGTVGDVLPGRHPSPIDNLLAVLSGTVVDARKIYAEAPEDEVLVVKDDGGVVLT